MRKSIKNQTNSKLQVCVDLGLKDANENKVKKWSLVKQNLIKKIKQNKQ
ncbi:MAG TPA: hypothetical protein PLX60_12695 [Chitinophagales bacterium]|nr:hypothetical protein [Chitinophagales bacterium]